MQNEYMLKLQKVIATFLKNENVKIILFGSRARGNHFLSSDVDIGIIPLDDIDEGKLALLREQIENLNIPYKIDIVNFSKVSQSFKEEALKEAVIWKDWH